jgi:hypothetical protein
MTHKIVFTELTDNRGEIRKIISIDKETGKLKKDGKATIWDGHAETQKMLFSDLPSYFSKLQPEKAVALGNSKYSPVSIVRTVAQNPPDTIGRNKDNFSFSTSNQLLFFDYDSRGNGKDLSVEEFIDAVSEIIPQFKPCAKVINYSASSHIYTQSHKKFSEGDGFHVYFIVKDSSGINKLEEVLLKRLWLNDHGYIFINKIGGMLVRTIFDKSVFNAHGIVFEAPPICRDGLYQKKPLPKYIEGDVLDTTLLKDLTVEENLQYKHLVKEAKNNIKLVADEVTTKYVKREAQKLIEHGVSAHKTEDIVLNRRNFLLMDEEILTFDDDTKVHVSAILENGKDYDGKYLYDPLEPDNGKSKATFLWNNGNNPIVYSHLHGGKIFNFNSFQNKNKNNKALAEGLEPSYLVDHYHTPLEAEKQLTDIIQIFLKERKNTGILFEAGGGKTQTTIKILAEFTKKKKLKVAFIGNSHEIAKERIEDFSKEIPILKIIKKFSGGGIEVTDEEGEKKIIGQGFGLIGGFNKKCKLPNADDLSFDKKRCDSCIHNIMYHSCPYINQYGFYLGKGYKVRHLENIRIYQQAHLFQPSVYDYGWKPDVLIIDEDIIRSMVKVFEITGDKNQLISEIIDQTNNSNDRLEEVIKRNKGKIKKQVNSLYYNRDITDLTSWEINFRVALSIILDLANFITEKSKVPPGDIWLENDRLYVGWIKRFHKKWQNIPVLYLDASGSEEIISKCMGIDIDFYRVRCKYQDNVEVIQVENNTMSKRWIKSKPENLEKLEKLVKMFNNGNTGFISYKTMKGVYLENDGTESKIPFVVNLVGDEKYCGWFGNIRGLNKFEDYKDLLVIGSHSIGDDGLLRYARVIYSNDNEFLFKDTPLVKKTIRMKDGNHKTLLNREYTDKRMQKVSDHFEKADSYQAIHRKRLVWRNEPKRVIYLSSNVQDITVSRTITFEALLKGQLQFEDFITSKGVWKFSDNKRMSEKTGIPLRTITDLKNEQSPKYNVMKFNVREIKSRKKKPDMEFLVSTDVYNADPQCLTIMIENIGYRILS